MSWSIYATARNVTEAKKYVEALKEPTPDQNYGTPRAAKDLVLAAIDASGVEAQYAVKVEACGHTPNGTTRILVEPILFVA